MARWLPPIVAVANAAAVFTVVAQQTGWLDIDSGPYLSIARNLAEHGRPISSFNFVGNFDHLPSAANFAPPGFGSLIALFMPLAGNAITAGKMVLFLSLFVVQGGAYVLLAGATGSRTYALLASVLLLWSTQVAVFAGLLLTELPFIACLVAASVAAIRVLDSEEPRARDWLALAFASALGVLIRYLGVFLPVSFAVLHAFNRRSRPVRGIQELGIFAAATFAPAGLWLYFVHHGESPLFPARPPALLTLGRAIHDTASFLGAALWPWTVLGMAVSLLPGLRRVGAREQAAPRTMAAQFVALALATYLVLLVTVRLREAHYPLDTLGWRYLAPASPLAFLTAGVLFHRLAWVRASRIGRLVCVLAATAVAANGARALSNLHMNASHPMRTETLRTLLTLVPPGETVLCNEGQIVSALLPHSPVIGIPSRTDMIYSLDLSSVVELQHVRWLVLFVEADGDVRYGEWYRRWLEAPPNEVHVTRAWRFDDGVVYHVEPSATS